MKSPFSYEVVISAESSSKYNLECGMSLAESYTEAAKIIEDYYGIDLIRIKDLTLYEESPLIILPKKMIEAYEESNGFIYSEPIPCDEKGNIILPLDPPSPLEDTIPFDDTKPLTLEFPNGMKKGEPLENVTSANKSISEPTTI